MILGLHGEALVGRIGRGALGDSEREEDPVEFQAEVPVKVPGRVLVHHEEPAQLRGDDSCRFRGTIGSPFGPVFL